MRAYPIMEDRMAETAVVEVALDVRVTVKLEACDATDAELRALVARDPESVRGAILSALDHAGSAVEKSAGWLDEEREAFVSEVIDAEVIYGDGVRAGQLRVGA